MSNRDIHIINKDITVAGGGLAGVCAAIAAAREGAEVALVNNRPVLGGNSSSEMRVWTVGATAMGNNRYAAESGIIGELDMENLYRNPEGNPHLWDALLYDKVKMEKRIELFLNTEIQDAEVSDGKILTAVAYQSGSEKRFLFKSKLFIDCTGDGSLGFRAGAAFMQGKESRYVFNEDMAPETTEPYTLGSTLLFYIKKEEKPVRFVPPAFAYSLEYMENLFESTGKSININGNGCDFWWIEYGGIADTIKDNELIRDELYQLVYGIWNYVKNSGKYDADNLTLEWVGTLPAKRESRRFIGALVLTQDHILSHSSFYDAVCCGGWPIDVHPEKGIYSKKSSCTQRPAGIYQIPLRCMCSKNIKNLMFAGRNISASHLAFASTRVMKTCGCMGQAAGTAAALLLRAGKLPEELSERDIKNIQKTLAKEDMWLFGVDSPDTMDIACQAEVTASGFRRFSSERFDKSICLKEDAYILFPSVKELRELKLMMKGMAGAKAQIEVYSADAFKGYCNMEKLGVLTGTYTKNMDWVTFSGDILTDGSQHLIVKIPARNEVLIGTSNESCCGVVGSIGALTGLRLFHPCFKLNPSYEFFRPENVVNGIIRPGNKPNIWISNSMDEENAWIQLEFKDKERIREIKILFNPDFNRDFNHLRPDYYKNGWDRMPPEMVKSFSLKIRNTDGNFTEIAWVEEQITRMFTLKTDINTDCIRIDFIKTYGSAFAQVFEIKVYR